MGEVHDRSRTDAGEGPGGRLNPYPLVPIAERAPDRIPPTRRAWSCPRAWSLLLLVALLGLAADLSSKAWSFRTVAPTPVELDREAILANPRLNPVPLHVNKEQIPGILDFRLVINHGAVAGVGAHQRTFLIGFTLVALTAGVILFGSTCHRARRAHFGIACVLAGGLGNLYDRIELGVVRDFLHLLPRASLPFDWRWPGGSPDLMPWVFNVADVLLLVGMVLLMRHVSVVERKRERTSAVASC